MYIDLPIIVIGVCSFFMCLNLLFSTSVKSLIICIILFYVLFYFRKYLFYCIRTTISGDYISNPVYYRSNSSLEKNRPLQLKLKDTFWALSNLGYRVHSPFKYSSLHSFLCLLVCLTFAALSFPVFILFTHPSLGQDMTQGKILSEV